MKAFASLLQIRLAGPSTYFGELVQKPFLGPNKEDALPLTYALLQDLVVS